MANYKNYMAICSEKTLQSNTKGFFMQFADHVCESAGQDWIENVFGKLSSDRERIRKIYEDSQAKDVIFNTLSCVQEIYRKKSAEVSLARRQDAERCARNEDELKSLLLYSQSVLRAPVNDSNVAIDEGRSLLYSLWGRVEILMKLKEYSLALNDLQQTLKLNVPDNFKGYVFWKMAMCYKGVGQDNKFKVAFGLAQKLFEGSPKQLELLSNDADKTWAENKKVCRKVVPNIAGKKNKKLPSASRKLCVKEAEDLGRYIAASEAIKTGETLVVEDPYVACLLPDCFGTHCHHCFERLVAPVGCTECSSVAFCKPECRDVALATYHKYECKYLDLLIGSGMSILSHTALRLVTQCEVERSLEIYRNKSGEKVFSLCTNASQRTSQDFLQRTLMAAFLLRCLQKSGYFNKPSNDDVLPTEEELCVGELLLFYLQILQFNAHEIYETVHSAEHRFRTGKALYIGVALYPTVSLFNHDCYLSVIRHFVGKKIVLTAARPFGSGEIVPENYGPMFTRKTSSERLKMLSGRYWFTCKCLACKLDWPSLEKGLDRVSKRIRCPTKGCIYIFSLPISSESAKCPKCANKVSLSDNVATLKNCEIQYDKAFELMDKEQTVGAIDLLREAIDNFHRVSCPPHAETHLAQEMLRALIADSGNLYMKQELI